MLVTEKNAGCTYLPPPRPNATTPTIVSFGLTLIDIEDFVDSGYGYGDISIYTWQRYVSQAIKHTLIWSQALKLVFIVLYNII